MKQRTNSAMQQYREARGFTRKQAAEGVGVDEHTWTRWEWGTMRPRADRLFAAARFLGVPAEALNDWPVKERTRPEASERVA